MRLLLAALISATIVVAASTWPQFDCPYGAIAAYERYMQGMKSEEAKAKYFPEVAEKANNFSSDPSIVYALPVESLDVGQTIGVVFRKPNDGVVGLSLATEEGDFVLRVAFRANYNGLQNTFILNTWKDRVWGRQIAVENSPEGGMATRIALFVTIGEDGFDISTNNIHLGFFYYTRSLTYDQVKYIQWDARDESATTKSALRQISINFPRQE